MIKFKFARSFVEKPEPVLVELLNLQALDTYLKMFSHQIRSIDVIGGRASEKFIQFAVGNVHNEIIGYIFEEVTK